MKFPNLAWVLLSRCLWKCLTELLFIGTIKFEFRSGLFETPMKPSPATARGSKVSRGAAAKSDAASSPSPLLSSRSPGSANSKPTAAVRRSAPKTATTPPEVVSREIHFDQSLALGGGEFDIVYLNLF